MMQHQSPDRSCFRSTVNAASAFAWRRSTRSAKRAIAARSDGDSGADQGAGQQGASDAVPVPSQLRQAFSGPAPRDPRRTPRRHTRRRASRALPACRGGSWLKPGLPFWPTAGRTESPESRDTPSLPCYGPSPGGPQRYRRVRNS